MSELPPPVPAATVIIVRDAAGPLTRSPTGTSPTGTSPTGTSGLEVLLLKRSDVGAFPNFWVFPGGRVDDTDPGEDELERARHAAVREAWEEVGLRVDTDTVHPFSHWTPPPIQPRRFATWFFVARWSGEEVRIDGREIVDHAWMAPHEAITSQLPMAPPTIVTLHELDDAGSFEHTRRTDLPRYVTRPAKSEAGVPVLLWHGDAGYEDADTERAGPRNRLWYPPDGPWRYERGA